ncbi:MAG: hypothetical protein ABIQ55_07220 [Gemmatimonadaceae bacterium]
MRARSVFLFVVAGACLSAVACSDSENSTGPDTVKGFTLPNRLASANQIDTVSATAVLPLYRGLDQAGNSVYYILTESNNVEESVRLGINWAPKLVHALNTKAVQTATTVSGGRANPNKFPILRFTGNVDFSPARKVVPGADIFPVDPSSTAGSVGDANYSPLVSYDGKTLYNAAHIANKTGLHDKVISMDTVAMTVKMQLVHGFYEGFAILYSSTEATDKNIAAVEAATFAPNLNAAPSAGDDKSFRSAREALIPVVNGPRGKSNPERQGLQSAVLGEGDPGNIFQEQAGCEDSSNPAAFCDAVGYSPLWDVHPVKWTQAAIDKGIRARVTTDKREVIAPLNVIDLLADGWLVTAAPGGPRNASLGGLNAADLIVNCPIIFVASTSR